MTITTGLAIYAHWCKSGMNVIEVINHLIIESKTPHKTESISGTILRGNNHLFLLLTPPTHTLISQLHVLSFAF